MPALRALFGSRRPLATLLLAVALWARLLVPDGYMVGTVNAGSQPVIEICTGHGALQVADPASRSADKRHGEHAPVADHVCAFAAASLAANLLAPVSVAPAPDATPAPAWAIALASVPGRGLAAPPPPKTGPPALV